MLFRSARFGNGRSCSSASRYRAQRDPLRLRQDLDDGQAPAALRDCQPARLDVGPAVPAGSLMVPAGSFCSLWSQNVARSQRFH
jgi:hypothetical protein